MSGRSTNAAASWIHMGPETGMPNVAVFDLEISAAGRLVAFTHGRGAFALLSPPEIIAGTRIEKAFTLSFATLPGGQYSVEFKNLLTDPTWQLFANVTGDGTTKVLIDTNAITPQRFYQPVLNN